MVHLCCQNHCFKNWSLRSIGWSINALSSPIQGNGQRQPTIRPSTMHSSWTGQGQNLNGLNPFIPNPFASINTYLLAQIHSFQAHLLVLKIYMNKYPISGLQISDVGWVLIIMKGALHGGELNLGLIFNKMITHHYATKLFD